jgi:hypothetical protein
VDKFIAALRKPLVVADASWADSIPGWLRQKVAVDRLKQAYRKEEGLATDAEVCCYLYTAAFHAPLNHEHNNIYLHLSAKVLREESRPVPDDVDCPETLNEYEQGLLRDLKRKIWEGAERGYRKGKRRERKKG